MNLIRAPSAELFAIVNWIRYVNLRDVVTLTYDHLTLESCHVLPLESSIPVPSFNWIRLTVPELGRLQFSIDRQLKVQSFTFFWW